MSDDLGKILHEWKFDPDDVRVRIIQGDDGREKIQLRVELGILQMEMSGRPDGIRPEKFESWLEYYEEQKRIHESTHPDSEPFALQESDLVRLWREGVQYYHRYLSLWYLEKYDLCARDTARNLRLFAFVREHATQERHKMQFDQWRPYVTAMHTRAVATPLVQQERFAEALQQIEAGIDAIREFLEEHGQTERAEQCEELVEMERWREVVQAKHNEANEAKETDPLAVLRRQMQQAIAQEEFEEAARLRDEIRRLSGEANPS
jgi:hypothetical protein